MRVIDNDIYMTRGDTLTVTVTCIKDGNPYELIEGDIIYLTVKDSVYTEDIIIQKKVTEFTKGKAIIEIEPNDTNDLSYGKYKYDIQLTFSDGKVKTIITPSDFNIEGEVTYD